MEIKYAKPIYETTYSFFSITKSPEKILYARKKEHFFCIIKERLYYYFLSSQKSSQIFFLFHLIFCIPNYGEWECFFCVCVSREKAP